MNTRIARLASDMSAALEKTLKAISIPLRSSVEAPDGGSGLIRIYRGLEGWTDFF